MIENAYNNKSTKHYRLNIKKDSYNSEYATTQEFSTIIIINRCLIKQRGWYKWR